ncbi:MAG: tripartite tricarboxylate transporter permease [Salinarimonas sp.]
MDLNLANLAELFLYSAGMWWVIIPAVMVGIVMGAIPGFAAHNTIIMLLPLTLAFDVDVALTFMVALYCASHLGGGIPAILLNIPGTGGAAATTLDGYAMSKKGLAARALALSFVASVMGGLVTSASRRRAPSSASITTSTAASTRPARSTTKASSRW